MPQLHLYVSDEVADHIKKRAEACGKSTSKYLADLATEDAAKADEWPEWFWTDVVGALKEDLEIPYEGDFEERLPL